ncbi:transposase, partial [Patescibacteria group bacterium]|nr:transposase [Patescibacteria group bacterium]
MFLKRKPIRLKNYNYSLPSYYYITVCTQKHRCFFTEYKSLKNIVKKEWELIPKQFTNTKLDEFVVMPNHLHGIIIIKPNHRATARVAPTLGNIIGSFKSRSTNKWLKYIEKHKINTIGKIWQRNYYEHIIRNKTSLKIIKQYIQENPLKWKHDKLNPHHIRRGDPCG